MPDEQPSPPDAYAEVIRRAQQSVDRVWGTTDRARLAKELTRGLPTEKQMASLHRALQPSIDSINAALGADAQRRLEEISRQVTFSLTAETRSAVASFLRGQGGALAETAGVVEALSVPSTVTIAAPAAAAVAVAPAPATEASSAPLSPRRKADVVNVLATLLGVVGLLTMEGEVAAAGVILGFVAAVMTVMASED